MTEAKLSPKDDWVPEGVRQRDANDYAPHRKMPCDTPEQGDQAIIDRHDCKERIDGMSRFMNHDPDKCAKWAAYPFVNGVIFEDDAPCTCGLDQFKKECGIDG